MELNELPSIKAIYPMEEESPSKSDTNTKEFKTKKFYVLYYLFSICSFAFGYYFYQYRTQINDMFFVYLLFAILLFVLGRILKRINDYENLNYYYHTKINERLELIQGG